MMAWLKRPAVAAFLIFTGVYALALGAIFWGTWSLDLAPVAPDCPSTYAVNDASAWLTSVLRGRDFIPSDLMHVVGGMYFWQELQFALAAWLAALGVAFYLRGRNLSHVASYGGGAAFGLMGYCFTLFSAGHLGWFIWLMYGPFAFGLTDRCVRKGKWHNWVLLGAVLAWASARQPDLWLLFTLLTFAYGCWCLVRERRTLAWKRLFAGVGVCAVATLLVGLPQFGHAIFTDLAGREAQIAGAGPAGAAAADDPAALAAKDAERWYFCTSWSLPPEDTLEFALAEIHGGSNDPRVYEKPGNAPYKGRLGQHGVVPPGAGGRHPVTGAALKPGDEYWLPYRQHSLYLGLLTLLFAGAGVFFWGARVKAPSTDGAAAPAADWRDVPFWLAAALLAYLSALGGFTPFYRLVYKLPFGDMMRCPVKFVHLLEFCVAVLAGFGLEGLRARFAAKGAWVVPALAVLAALNVFDLARVDAKYLAVQDVAYARAPNDVAADVLKAGGGKVYVAMPPQEGAALLGETLRHHLAETAQQEGEEGVRFLLASGSTLQRDPTLADRVQKGRLKPVGFYTFSRREGLRRCGQQGASFLLLEKVGAVAVPRKDPPPARAQQLLGWLSLLATCATLVFAGAGTLRPPQPRSPSPENV